MAIPFFVNYCHCNHRRPLFVRCGMHSALQNHLSGGGVRVRIFRPRSSNCRLTGHLAKFLITYFLCYLIFSSAPDPAASSATRQLSCAEQQSSGKAAAQYGGRKWLPRSRFASHLVILELSALLFFTCVCLSAAQMPWAHPVTGTRQYWQRLYAGFLCCLDAGDLRRCKPPGVPVDAHVLFFPGLIFDVVLTTAGSALCLL